MNSILGSHLQQISETSVALSALPFVSPNIFANAILKSADIVSLIRDTDSQERALFTVPSQKSTQDNCQAGKPNGFVVGPKRNTAVHSVLGANMIDQLRGGGAGGLGGGVGGFVTADVNVGLLLRGAEKLTTVYHIPGGFQRIKAARERFEQLTESITNYEALAEAQRSQLEILHDNAHDDVFDAVEQIPEDAVSNGMIYQEQKVIEQLQAKKEQLEIKIKSIDRQMDSVYQKL
ncbi:DASH complex subunit Spc34-domain-containing protein [Geopyxis carbonaria]|nr:DASH complex subunit Spc34-domain-containing protein [Geopyxis carbonaria]